MTDRVEISQHTIDELRAIVAQMKAVPQSAAMQTFWRTEPSAPCGSAACLLGHAALRTGLYQPHPDGYLRVLSTGERESWHEAGCAALGIRSMCADRAAWKLAYLNSWPDDLRKEYAKCEPGSPEAVAVIEARVERWIETGGVDVADERVTS